MIDAKIKNGDLGGQTAPAELPISGGSDALFQRALICMTVPKGSFVYDRELGALNSVSLPDAKTELLLNEALAKYEDAAVSLIERDDSGIRVCITIGGESRTEEVRQAILPSD